MHVMALITIANANKLNKPDNAVEQKFLYNRFQY